MSRVELLTHCTVFEEYPEAGGLRTRRSQSVDDLLGVQLQELRCGHRGAERAARRRGVPVVVVGSPSRFPGTDCDLVTDDDGLD